MTKKTSRSSEVTSSGTLYTLTYSTYKEDEILELEKHIKSYMQAETQKMHKTDVLKLFDSNNYSHWITHTDRDADTDFEDTYYECSSCNHSNCCQTPFCPHCGDLMWCAYRFTHNFDTRVHAETHWLPMYISRSEIEKEFYKIMNVEFDSNSCSIYMIED